MKYDETLDYIDRSFDGLEDSGMETVLGGVKSFYTFELLLELKRPDLQWQEYKEGGEQK